MQDSGSTGVPPALKGDSTQWKLHKDKTAVLPSRRRSYMQPDAEQWSLEDSKGTVTHKGQLEGGIDTNNYFVLMKKADGFTVMPVTAWYTFKPPPRRAAMSLEEAEAEMEKQHTSHFSGAGRLTQAIAKAEVQGLDGGPDEGGAFGADSDEEEKRANRAKAASADQSSMTEARNKNTNADVNIIKGDKAAEDWEYEENAADDDDDMGEQEDVANREASPSPRRSPPSRGASSPTGSAEGEEGGEGQGLSKQGRELQRLLKTTGLSDSDNEDARENNSLMSDDEDEDEIEDLDALAQGMERKPPASGKPPSAAESGRKRSPTPPLAAGKGAAKRKADGEAQPAAKRQRSATPMSQAGPKPASSPAVKAEPGTAKPEGSVTIAEIRNFVANVGGVIAATELSRHFRDRLITQNDKDQFRGLVKSGLKFDKATKTLGLGK